MSHYRLVAVCAVLALAGCTAKYDPEHLGSVSVARDKEPAIHVGDTTLAVGQLVDLDVGVGDYARFYAYPCDGLLRLEARDADGNWRAARLCDKDEAGVFRPLDDALNSIVPMLADGRVKEAGTFRFSMLLADENDANRRSIHSEGIVVTP